MDLRCLGRKILTKDENFLMVDPPESYISWIKSAKKRSNVSNGMCTVPRNRDGCTLFLYLSVCAEGMGTRSPPQSSSPSCNHNFLRCGGPIQESPLPPALRYYSKHTPLDTVVYLEVQEHFDLRGSMPNTGGNIIKGNHVSKRMDNVASNR